MEDAIFNTLNDLLGKVELDNVSSEATGDYPELPDGYYLCEVESAELKESKSSGNPMASFRLSVVEDGVDVIFEEDNIKYIKLEKTKGRKIFKHFVLKDDVAIKRFVSDMLKFEDNDGNSFLPKDAFLSADLLEEAIQSLIGMRIYVQSTTTTKDDKSSTWTNFISWTRAAKLELPM